MNLYRFDYDDHKNAVSGSCDVHAETLRDAWERFEKAHPGVDLTVQPHEIEERFCKACGGPMGNLGLRFDECLNPKCEMHAKEQ